MIVKNICSKTCVALIAGACAAFLGGADAIPARTQLITALAGDQSGGALNVNAASRIVLHGVRFQSQSDTIDKHSQAILDYAVQTLKQSQEQLVYVEVCLAADRLAENSGGRLPSSRRAKAVVSYFEQKGIPHDRLVLLGSDAAPRPHNESVAEARSVDRNVEQVRFIYISKNA
jgi:outer membrane protein OmpA-like peptidoglycan-associated protein